jgi:predicted outer membrane protein
MAHANPIQIQKYLKGVDYPASKAQLIEKAKELGADENICASLEQLPDEDFQTPAEVSQAFSGPSSDEVEAPKPSQPAAGGKEFLGQMMQDSLAEVELCVLALQKASDEDLRKFAQMMIDEHSKFGQTMEKVAGNMKIDLPKQLSKEQASSISRLEGLNGRDFDKRFMEQNLQYHENDLKVFRHYAAEEKDAGLKKLAEAGVEMFSKHLKMVQDLERKMMGGK